MQGSTSLSKPLLWLSAHPTGARLAAILFMPAIAVLMTKIVVSMQATVITHSSPEQLLSIALFLFCIELAWMAYVDLRNAALVASLLSSPATHLPDVPPLDTCSPTESTKEIALLNRFFSVVVSTVVLELVGFYAALFSLLVGAVLVIVSQLWFNLLAGVALYPAQSPPVVLFRPKDRVDVLSANCAALFSLSLWPLFGMRLSAAISLLLLITLFLTLKYVPLAYRKLSERP